MYMGHTMNHRKIRVLVVDNHQRFRTGLCTVLDRDADIEVVGDGTHDNSESLIQELQPDVVLMSMNGGLQKDICLIQRMKQMNPEMRIVLLTVLEPSDEWLRTACPSISGYLTKNVSPFVLVDVVRRLVS